MNKGGAAASGRRPPLFSKFRVTFELLLSHLSYFGSYCVAHVAAELLLSYFRVTFGLRWLTAQKLLLSYFNGLGENRGSGGCRDRYLTEGLNKKQV